ncbi:MAG: hypothetical protein U1D30_03310 [Planctomycetota bacterium]
MQLRPVSGKPAKEDKAEYLTKGLFLLRWLPCCFQEGSEQVSTKTTVNHQLVLTGQAKQVGCVLAVVR